jgi:Holliday junction resolvase RusA-like endonuclease
MEDGLIASMTIFGQLPSIKNRRRIMKRGRDKLMVIKSTDALRYEQAFLMAIPQKMRVGYDGPVSVKVRVWYQSRRSDLSIELLFDLLAKSGIIINDRQVHHVESFKGLDRDNPRLHFTVRKWEEECSAP